MELRPDDDEARAALYNAACAHTALKQWQPAVDAVVRAVNDYELKLTVALEDDDLVPLRQRREWMDALGSVKGGLSDGTFTQLRAEAKAPFRLVRVALFGTLLAGASLGLFIILTRLARALQGGDGAPELAETLQNAGINTTAVAVLAFLVVRDLRQQQRDQAVVEREEALARLQVAVSDGAQLPLASFRGTVRPVLLAGSRTYINKCLKSVEPLYAEMRERGLSLVPLETGGGESVDRLRQLKKEFAAGSSSSKKGFAGGKPSKGPPADRPAAAKDRRWQLQAYDVPEWLEWVETQKEAAGVKGDGVWVQIQLDGTVRSSGVGTPPWTKFLGDLPPLDDVRTKWTDGIGR